jgi:hypothetical protein
MFEAATTTSISDKLRNISCAVVDGTDPRLATPFILDQRLESTTADVADEGRQSPPALALGHSNATSQVNRPSELEAETSSDRLEQELNAMDTLLDQCVQSEVNHSHEPTAVGCSIETATASAFSN